MRKRDIEVRRIGDVKPLNVPVTYNCDSKLKAQLYHLWCWIAYLNIL